MNGIQRYMQAFGNPTDTGNRYQVEVTKTRHPKSGYRIVYTADTEYVAAFYYSGINIGNGYKKRLRRNGTIIRKEAS